MASLVAVGLLLAVRADGQFNSIELGTVSRVAAQAGTDLDVRVASGSLIDEIEELRFSDPRIRAELKTLEPLAFSDQPNPDFGHFRVRIAADTPPGRYEVRAGGRHGISNPRLFLVTPLPTSAASSVSHDPTKPTPLPLNQVWQTQSTSSQIDFYALELDSEQTVKIDLIAQRLDSSIIGRLELIDPAGRVVMTSRGSDQFDPALEYTPKLDGTYVLAVHDFLYRGGNDFFYLLDARTGDARNLDFFDAGELPGWLGPAGVTADEPVPSVSEQQETQAVAVPFSVPGSFDARDDEDVYEFTANAGDRFAIDLVSSRMGEPTDPRLVVLQQKTGASGEKTFQQVLQLDDSQSVGGADVSLFSKDPQGIFQVPETGTYRIVVRDLDTGETFGRIQHYLLDVRPPRPGVELVAYRPYPHRDVNQSKPFGSKLFRGGSESIRVLAVRKDGWSGPIEINVDGLPPGVDCEPARIAAGQSETQLTLVAKEQVEAWTGPIKVTASFEIDGTPTTVSAHPVTLAMGRAHSREFIQSRRCHELLVATSPEDLAPLSVQIEHAPEAGDQSDGTDDKGGSENPAENSDADAVKAKTIEATKNSSLKLPIRLIRREGGSGVCVLRARDLPPGVTVGEVNIPADKSDGTLELKITPQAAAGVYSLWLQAETKIKVKANPQALERANQYRSHLQTLRDDPASEDKREAIDAAIKVADQRVQAATPASQPQELTVFIPSPHVTIHVVDSQ